MFSTDGEEKGLIDGANLNSLLSSALKIATVMRSQLNLLLIAASFVFFTMQPYSFASGRHLYSSWPFQNNKNGAHRGTFLDRLSASEAFLLIS